MLGNYDYYSDRGSYGMKESQGDFPVFMLVGIDNYGVRFRIASNSVSNNDSDSKWVIRKARVMVTRFWDASTCYLVLQSHIPNLTDPIPSLPELDGKELQPEDDIEVWAGYTSDNESFNGGLQRKIFTGSIDIIDRVGTDRGGHSITIQGRDRMKWLMDTVVSYNAYNDQNPSSIFSVKDLSPGEAEFKPRSEVILEIAQRGIGYIPKLANSSDRFIEKGAVYDIHIAANDPSDETRIDNPDFHYQSMEDTPGFSLSNLNRYTIKSYTYGTNFEKEALAYKNPAFNIYVSRPGFDNVNEAIGGIGLNTMNQSPIDFIKYLAQHEVYPTELFQDHMNGCLYYTPRMNDIVGLDDRTGNEVKGKTYKGGAINVTVENSPPKSDRLFRTYYYRPESCIKTGKALSKDIDFRQQIFVLKEEESSLSVRTNYTVSNSSPDTDNSIIIHYKSKPSSWEGKDFPSYFMQIDDENVETAAEAGAIATTFAGIHSRDTKSGMITLQGDPTLSPSEAIQIIGGMKTQDYKKEKYESELKDFLNAQDIVNRDVRNLQEQIWNAREESKKARFDNRGQPVDKGESKDTSSKGECDARTPTVDGTKREACINNLNKEVNTSEVVETDKISGVESNDFYSAQQPPSIYRIEAIIHKYNDDKEGYYTEAMILSPYG